MTNEEFLAFVDEFNARCKRLLIKKGSEYAPDDDRLGQFRRSACLNMTYPTQECWSMASKHLTSIAEMVKDPNIFSEKRWNEKLRDAYNYIVLLAALVDEYA